MPKIVQELTREFPEHVAMLRHLDETDGHFHRIGTAYHEIGLLLDDAAADGQRSDSTHLVQLRAHRAALKEEILELLMRPETVEDFLP